MSAVRLALSELRRLTIGRMPKLAVAALAAIPLLCGGLYLYANSNPYGRLDRVPAALVVEDAGATKHDGSRLLAGRQVADELVRADTFDWHRVSARQAATGVRQGRYDFALTIPAGFSGALVSSGDAASTGTTPRQGTLVLTTNDANNYLVNPIAAQVVTQVRSSLAAQVGGDAANEFLDGFARIHSRTAEAAAAADQLGSGVASARAGARALADGGAQLTGSGHTMLAGAAGLATDAAQTKVSAEQVANRTATLSGGLAVLRTSSARLPAQTRSLATSADQVVADLGAAAEAGEELRTVSADLAAGLSARSESLIQDLADLGALSDQDLATLQGDLRALRQPLVDADATLRETDTQFDALRRNAQQVSADADVLAATAPEVSGGIANVAAGGGELSIRTRELAEDTTELSTGVLRLRDGLGSTAIRAAQLAGSSAELEEGLGVLSTGAGHLAVGLRGGLNEIPNLDDDSRATAAETIASPVQVQTVKQTKAPGLGAGLAPFFLSLSAWIGGYVLFLLVRPLSTRAMAANQTPLRVAVGGWLAPAVLGVVQMLLLFAVVMFGLRFPPEHPVEMAGFMVLASMTFIAVLHMLNAWFGPAGQFLGLVLLVLQLVSSGGPFPWQTVPEPLQGLHHVLPMGYSVQGLRHLMYGGDGSAVGRAVIVLGAYLIGSLLLTAVSARRRRVWTVARLKPEVVI